jgi:hypothetical protein
MKETDLKIFTADKAGVHIDPGQGHGTQLLKVKVQDTPAFRKYC